MSIKEINKIIEDNYMIKIDKIEKNKQSTDGNVYIVYTDKEKYVLKIYDELDHTEAMTFLHNKLISCGLNVPKIIKTRNNELYSKINDKENIVIYSFMKGKQISDEHVSIDNFIVSKIANELYKLHKSTYNDNAYNLPILPFSVKNKTNRNSILHFDLTKDNIFIDNDKIGFIDFDDAKYGPSVCDVSIFISILFFSKKRGVDINKAKKFIDEYYSNEPTVKQIEIPLIKEYAINWIDYILNNNSFDTSTTESFVVKRKLVEENLIL